MKNKISREQVLKDIKNGKLPAYNKKYENELVWELSNGDILKFVDYPIAGPRWLLNLQYIPDQNYENIKNLIKEEIKK